METIEFRPIHENNSDLYLDNLESINYEYNDPGWNRLNFLHVFVLLFTSYFSLILYKSSMQETSML